MASRRSVQNTVQSENKTFRYSQNSNDDGSTVNSDVFLEASLQFLHQLLAERNTQNNYAKKDTDSLNDQVQEYDQCLNYIKGLLPNLKFQNTSELSQDDESTVYNTLNSNRNAYNNSLKSVAQEYESEIESASSLSLNFVQKKCQNCAKQVPVEVHVTMNEGKSSASPTTLLIKVPNAIMNFLRNKPSKISLDKSDSNISASSKGEVRKGNRFTKTFMRLLKGKKTSASMVSIKRSMNSEEIFTPRMTKSNFESHLINHNDAISDSSIKQKINCAARSCFSLKNISQPQEAIESNIFQEKPSIEMPMNNKIKDKIYVTIKPSMMETDVALENCTINSKNESPTNNRTLDTESERIIPLRYVKASSQISQSEDEQSILENLERFWSMNKNSISSREKNYSEIPVQIKTASNPLVLEKQSKKTMLQNSCKSSQKQDENDDILSDKEHQTKVLIEMLVGTLPIGINIAKNLERLENTKIMKDTESSALEILLQHIFIDNENYKINQPVEKDIKREQILPKRQLSKISICSSSGSLSYTEQDVEKQLLTSDSSWQMDNYNMECESNIKSENSNLSSASNYYQKINRNEINMHENTTSFHPLLSKQSSQDQRELVNAMIRWWGPQVNYTTWPLNKKNTSSNSVSLNHLS